MGLIVDLWKGNTVNDKKFYDGCDFVIIKASQGLTKDPKADVFITDCRLKKKPFWLYVYLNKGDYIKQLDYFTQRFNAKLRNCDNLIGIIADIEDGQTADEALAITKYMQSIANFYRLKWGIYIGYSNFGKYKKSVNVVTYCDTAFLWEARYTDKYSPHDEADLWQFAGDVKTDYVSGDVDLSVVRYNRHNLKWYCTKRKFIGEGDLLAKNVVQVAKGQLGYKEKESNFDIFMNNNNIGDNNYTKYGQFMDCNGDYWCASFVSYVFYRAFGYAKGKLILGSYSPACNTLMDNITKTSNPQVGDVVFFSGSRHGGANHVGIVIDLDSSCIRTIEGNASPTSGITDNGGMVCSKVYKRNNDRIICYGRPKYSVVIEEYYTNPLPTVYPARGWYYNGCDRSDYVKQIQKFLLWYFDKRGEECDIVVNGVYRDLTEKYVKMFQVRQDLKQNGCWGKLCYEKARLILFRHTIVNI